ncbi:hypothetical protein JCM11641_003791 [Rhodosporidiobolus odoratus]
MLKRAPSPASGDGPPILRPIPVRPPSPSAPQRPSSRDSTRLPLRPSSRTSISADRRPPPPRPPAIPPPRPAAAASRATYPPATRAPSPSVLRRPGDVPLSQPRRPTLSLSHHTGLPDARVRPPSPARPSQGLPPPPSFTGGSGGGSRSTSQQRVAFDLGRGPQPIPRSRANSIPTPPPSRPASRSDTTARQPLHLAYMNNTQPPPPINLRTSPEGTRLPGNLIVSRGEPRIAQFVHEERAANSMSQALKAHERLQRDFYCTLVPGKALLPFRKEITLDAQCMCESALAVLRYMFHMYAGLVVNGQCASRLVNMRWGDNSEWRSIMDLQRHHCIKPSIIAEHNAKILWLYFEKDKDHFTTHLISMEKWLADTQRAFGRLRETYNAEVEEFIVGQLYRQAVQGNRPYWYFLQYRARSFGDCLPRLVESRTQLIRGLDRYLYATRSRGGISGNAYYNYYKRLQEYLPPGVEARARPELYKRT